jgi:hypothetical protein
MPIRALIVPSERIKMAELDFGAQAKAPVFGIQPKRSFIIATAVHYSTLSCFSRSH